MTDQNTALEDFVSIHDYLICPNLEVAISEVSKIYYHIHSDVVAALTKPHGCGGDKTQEVEWFFRWVARAKSPPRPPEPKK